MLEKLESRRLLTATLNSGVLTITGGAAGDSLVAENQGSNIKVIENNSKISTFKANKVNHIVFNGLAGNDTLTNKSSKPSIMNGGDDIDTMIGSPNSADEFNGGAGADTASYASRSQNLTLSIGFGADGANGGAENDNIKDDVERVVGGTGNDDISGANGSETLEGGPGDDQLHGFSGVDVLLGGTGNDLLDAGSGNDRLEGELGNDTYRKIPAANDSMIDTGGIDTLDYSPSPVGFFVDMSMDAGQPQDMGNGNGVKLTGVFENLIGSSFGDVIRDGAGPNKIDVGAGGDNVFAFGGGDDWIIGGADGDTLRGGAGNDLFDGVSTGVDGADIIIGNDGFDTLDLSGRSNNVFITTDSDGAHAVNDGEGGEQDAVLTMEHVIGGSGNDEVTLGEDADRTVNYWFEGRGGLDSLAIVTPAFLFGTGNCTLQGGDGSDPLLLGGSGNDLMEGGAGDDVMGGEAGNDVMDGGSGSDFMDGGDGDDVYREVPGSSDILDEAGDTGTDLIDLSNAASGITIAMGFTTPQIVDAAGNTITLAGDFENLNGSRFNDDLTGNALPNIIHAGDGNDDVDAYREDDSVFGEAGDDLLRGAEDNDLVDGGSGNDILSAQFDEPNLTATARDVLLGGEGNDILEGGQDNDSMLGGNGNDVLFGGDGDDTLKGEAGNDHLNGDAGDDLLVANDGVSDTLDGGSGGETLGDTAVFDLALDLVSNCETNIAAKQTANLV